MRRALWATVAELADAVRPRDDIATLVRVTSLTLDLPIEIVMRPRDTEVEMLGNLPRWRWASGFDVQPGRLRLWLEQVDVS